MGVSTRNTAFVGKRWRRHGRPPARRGRPLRRSAPSCRTAAARIVGRPPPRSSTGEARDGGRPRHGRTGVDAVGRPNAKSISCCVPGCRAGRGRPGFVAPGGGPPADLAAAAGVPPAELTDDDVRTLLRRLLEWTGDHRRLIREVGPPDYLAEQLLGRLRRLEQATDRRAVVTDQPDGSYRIEVCDALRGPGHRSGRAVRARGRGPDRRRAGRAPADPDAAARAGRSIRVGRRPGRFPAPATAAGAEEDRRAGRPARRAGGRGRAVDRPGRLG